MSSFEALLNSGRLPRFALLLIAAAGLSQPTSSADLSLQAGLGYDLLSQKYFLDSATAAGTDSIIVNWALTTNYLDDLSGQLWLKYSPFDNGRLQLRGRYDQTNEFVRTRLGGEFKSSAGSTRLQFSGEAELKDRYHGESNFGDSYLRGYARGKLSRPVSPAVDLELQLKTDGVRFSSSSNYNFNYYRVGADIGLRSLVGSFSSADLKVTVDHRRVPDSLSLDYLAVGAQAGFLGFFDWGELDLLAALVRKSYRQESHKDDHHRLLLEADHRWRHGRGWFTRQLLQSELTLYHPDDLINVDYSLIGFGLLGGFENVSFTISAGPVFERLHERETEFSTVEDYAESGLQINLDHISPGRLFASVESTWGRRSLKTESDLQTGFSFERLSLISDITLVADLRLNLFFSAEWEWHDIRQENSRLYLLSSNLTYQF